jgi:dTDP-4-dehydrorhamnose reductase
MVRRRPSRRLPVTGALGFTWLNVCRIAARHYETWGICNRHSCLIPNVNIACCDLTEGPAVEKLFSAIRPDAVIHAAAAADPNYCQAHEQESAAINITAAVTMARQCARYAIPCIFTSTDPVFDGTKPPYPEEAPVGPLSVYGEQKAAAEREMPAAHRRVVVCRKPLMYGDAPPHVKSFIQPMILALRNGREPSLFTDEYRTPLSAIDAANGLLLAVVNAWPGIFTPRGAGASFTIPDGMLPGRRPRN